MANPKRVMLVEDDALLSYVGEKLIKKLGFDVVAIAASGEDALKKVDEYNPDIIVMDVQLAGSINGIQAVEEMRKRHINIPVIFLSGDDEQSFLKRAKEVNCIDYLLKPVSASTLLAPLEKAANLEVKQSYHAA